MEVSACRFRGGTAALLPSRQSLFVASTWLVPCPQPSLVIPHIQDKCRAYRASQKSLRPGTSVPTKKRQLAHVCSWLLRIYLLPIVELIVTGQPSRTVVFQIRCPHLFAVWSEAVCFRSGHPHGKHPRPSDLTQHIAITLV